MKKIIFSMITGILFSSMVFAGEKHFSPELLEQRKPYGKIYLHHQGAFERGFSNFLSIANIIVRGKEEIFHGFKSYIYYSCKSDECVELDLIYIHDRPSNNQTEYYDDTVKILSTVTRADVDDLMAGFYNDLEVAKEKISKEGVYDSTSSVSSIPYTPVVVLPATIVSAVIDTIKAPFWKLIKAHKATTLDSKSRQVLEGLFDTASVGLIERIDYKTFNQTRKSLDNQN